jgi:hypothetical protein
MSKKDRPKGAAGRTKEECESKAFEKVEREIHNQISSYLNLHRIVYCHARTDRASRMTVGWPDFTFAMEGNAVAVEVKTTSGKVSREQYLMHEQMRDNGWAVMVVRSLEDFVDQFRAFQKFKGIKL